MKICTVESTNFYKEARTLSRPVALLYLFTQYVGGQNHNSEFALQGHIAPFFTPTCPPGWEPLNETEDHYLKFTNNETLIGTTGGDANPTLTERHMPLHSHMIAGPPAQGCEGDPSDTVYLGKGPYPGSQGYKLESTTSKPDAFRTGTWGYKVPEPIPQPPFRYAILCVYNSNELPALAERITKLEGELPESPTDLDPLNEKVNLLTNLIISIGALSLIIIIKNIADHYKFKALEKKMEIINQSDPILKILNDHTVESEYNTLENHSISHENT